MRYTVTRSKAAASAEQLQLDIGELCNGSTYDSDSYCLGSNPSSPAISLHGQAVKTLPSQGKIMGSIPIGGATKQSDFVLFFCCFGFFAFLHFFPAWADSLKPEPPPPHAESETKLPHGHARCVRMHQPFVLCIRSFLYKIVIQNITSL